MGAGEFDYAQRDLRWTKACFGPLVHDREFADHNKQLMDGWLSAWVPRALRAARTMQPLWSQPDHRPPRLRGLARPRQEPIRRDRPRPRPGGPEGAGPVTTTATSAFGAVNATSSGMRRHHADERPGRGGHRPGHEGQAGRDHHLPAVDDPVDGAQRTDYVYDEFAEALGEEPGSSPRTTSRRACRRTTAGWSTRTTGRSCSPIPRTRPSTSASTSACNGHRGHTGREAQSE